MFGYYDLPYIVIAIVSLVLGMLTQGYINKAYNKWSQVPSGLSATGAEVARRMLDQGGAGSVGITTIAGHLTDNFDPRDNKLHLSQENYSGGTVASVAVACHEAGHAIQTATGYAPIRLRTALVPVVSLTSQAWSLLFIAGLFLNILNLMKIAVALFAFSVLFQLVTLPVEIDASRRAVAYLKNISAIDHQGAKEVLTAAALTYVASALISIMQLLYYVSRVNGRDD